MSYFFHTSYKLPFFTRGTSKILLASFELLFIARVTVAFYIGVTRLII